MCGIAGFVANRAHDRQFRPVLRAMTDVLAHRGPDDEGFFECSAGNGGHAVGLGHRRLSIIDLDGGHQPMTNEDGTVHIVFNGEIYNYKPLREELIARGHRFTTSSDTETIVHAYEEYGDDCVDRLDGMFAFAIWDSNRERLFLARDRFGKKPLFVCDLGNAFVFASEIKAILEFPGVTARMDPAGLWDYLLYRYVPGPRTLFDGIQKLDSGSTLSWCRSAYTTRRYYSPPDRMPPPSNADRADPTKGFFDRLDAAVASRMMSDVPFGAFLSGGIDSSAIVALMARHSRLPVKTFSIGFQEADYNELEYARLIARQYHTDHHELSVSAGDLMKHLPQLVWYRDAPVSEPSDIPIYLLSREARRFVKMVLTGEGSDEILAGYPKHQFEWAAHFYRMIPGTIRRDLVQPLVSALPYGFRRIKTAVSSLGQEDFAERMPRWFGAMNADERGILAAYRPPARQTSTPIQFDLGAGNTPLRQILYFDQTSWLPDNLLERGDRMTMAASLEARMPFLDRELVSYVSSLPDRYRLSFFGTKRLLRRAMRNILPRPIIKRPKIGFRVPVNDWFKGPMRDFLCDHLIGSDSRSSVYFHKPVVKRLVEEHANGRQNHEKLLWSLLNLELWHRQYRVS